MIDNQRWIFVREPNGPLDEIRYRAVARCNPNTANDVVKALKEAGHQVIAQADRRPPHSY